MTTTERKSRNSILNTAFTQLAIIMERHTLVTNAAHHAIFQKGTSFIAFSICSPPWEPSKWTEEFPVTDKERDTKEYTDKDAFTHRSYVRMLQILKRPTDLHMTKGIDMSGKTIAHAFSITKSMMGMLWAHYVYNRENDPRLTNLRDNLLGKNGPERENIRHYLNANRPVTSSMTSLLDVPLRKFFTQSTGLHTSDFSLPQALTLIVLISTVGEHGARASGGAKLQDFNSFLHDNWIEAPLENCFNYDNLLTQVASFALKDYMSRLTQNEKFLVKDEVVRIFFPPEFSDAHHGHIQEWPVVSAGYRYYYKNGDEGGEVSNTLTLAGLKMTGQDFITLGRHLLNHHAELLIKIHDDADFYTVLPDDPVEIKNYGRSAKAGWRYSFFCWIPVFKDEDDARRKWVVFIGHEGQYMLFELVSRSLFVRQHFALTDSVGENIDFVSLAGPALEKIKYREFCCDCKDLLDQLEKVMSTPN